MNAEIKKLWVAALRSGDYKQGRSRLRNSYDNKFCCLGVLCNLHAQMHPDIAAKQTSSAMYFGEDCYLPKKVKQWAQLFERNPSVNSSSLVELNDENRMSFSDIADVIERYL